MDGATRLPLARSEGLVVEELGDEVLVYDLAVKHAHCLSPTAAAVWRRCDGRTPPQALAQALSVDAVEIARAIDELDRCDLLVSPLVPGDGLSRRELGLKVTKVAAGAAALPLILSIAAPAAAATDSQEAICLAIDVSHGCGDCNDGSTAGGPCCCCQPGNGSAKTCAAGIVHCTELGGPGSKCTEKDA